MEFTIKKASHDLAINTRWFVAFALVVALRGDTPSDKHNCQDVKAKVGVADAVETNSRQHCK